MISDKCPECGTDHIDVQSLTFAKVGRGPHVVGGLWWGAGRVLRGCPCLRLLLLLQAAPTLHNTAHPPLSQALSCPLLPSPAFPSPHHVQLAEPGIGRIEMQYRRTECTPPDDIKVGGVLGCSRAANC